MLSLQILLNSLVLGTQILLIAAPLYLVYSVAKVFHLGLGAIAAATAYGFYWVLQMGGGFGLAALASLVLCLLFAVASCLLLNRYIVQKQPLFALLVSFSAGVGLEAILAIAFGSDGKVIVQGVLPTVHAWGLNLTLPGLMTIVVGIIGVFLMAIILHRTPFGRSLRSLAENSAATQSLGLSASRTRFITLSIAILMTGFVGVMTGFNTTLSPGMGFHIIILAFVSFLIGGTTRIAGTFIASYLVAIVPQLIIGYSDFSVAWQLVFVFILAAVMLLIWPKGLFYSSVRNS